MANSLNPAHTHAEFSQCSKESQSSDALPPTALQPVLEVAERFVQMSNSTRIFT